MTNLNDKVIHQNFASSECILTRKLCGSTYQMYMSNNKIERLLNFSSNRHPRKKWPCNLSRFEANDDNDHFLTILQQLCIEMDQEVPKTRNLVF